MIKIRRSPTADTRTCDFANVTKETLYASSEQHIVDVRAALDFFECAIQDASASHDNDKLTDIDGFHRDFVTGFKQTEWWDRHRQLNRHHLNMADGVRDDVNLIDVLDFIADCVMAGMARSGSVYPLQLSPELLEKAFQNTVAMLKQNVVVVPDDSDAERAVQHDGLSGAQRDTSQPTPAAGIARQEAEQGWQPIASAPKDGTPVLLSNGAYVHEAYWSATYGQKFSNGHWNSTHGTQSFLWPTHWMPLPAPPRAATEA